MKKFFKKYLLYIMFVFVGICCLLILFTGKINTSISEFFESIENKTFDLRQEITSKYREHSKDIVILAIDTNTYEYVNENYGSWPMPKYIYADVINYIETQNPKLIAFDLLFPKSLENVSNDENKLAELFKKYDNLYTAINFDYMPEDLRTPQFLDDKYKINITNKANMDIFSLTNVRLILPTIMENTKNIGNVNFLRAYDGVLRDFPPFIYYEYQKAYFPHLGFLIGLNAIDHKNKDFIIDKNLKLNVGNKKFPMTVKGTIFLNWYNKKNDSENNSTVIYDSVSMADIIKAAKLHKEGKVTKFDKFFENKIVYIGATAVEIGDIKTVPIERYMPGVEIHTTFVNNMMDNNFIHRLTLEWDFGVTLILCLILAFVMLRIEYSRINYKYFVPINIAILFLTLITYYFISVKLMQYFNLWIAVVMPTVGIISTFILIYIMRYFSKSQDYEYTYRLATTDGLTDLYNHRFFQEKMIECVENSKKSGKKFSLILTDIDFFKKFNDTYGHQAGDTVLRQVAKILKKYVKKTDFVCRYGGEEMSVILINSDKETATKIAERLCKAVSSNICKLSEDLEVNVTISLGVSTYPDNGDKPSELIEYSDKGLYYAKENGRNQVGIVKEE